MNCFYHPETPAVVQCKKCKKGICKSCVAHQKLMVCKPCLREIDWQIQYEEKVEKKARKKALLISAVIFCIAAIFSIVVSLSDGTYLEEGHIWEFIIALILATLIFSYVAAGIPYGYKAYKKILSGVGGGIIFIHTPESLMQATWGKILLGMLFVPFTGWFFLTKELFSYFKVADKIKRKIKK